MTDLRAPCEQPLPELAQRAIAEFNAGEYYHQHDHFEALWMQTPGAERDLYQGILQIGVGYYQILQGNWRGAVKMLNRGLERLEHIPDRCQGVYVDVLRSDAQQVREALLARGAEQIGDFPRGLLRPVVTD
jgi:predicted metal-dependent hydrolase